MADHLVDIYDENMVKIGTELKSVAHRDGLWHASIHCWIVRDENETGRTFVLFQKRAASKDLFPDCLDITAAGHYQSGESVAQGVREIVEEVGLQVPFEELIPLGVKVDLAKLPGLLNREFCHTFLLSDARPVESYNLGLDEVEGLVQIAVGDGLDLFGSRRDEVLAEGVELDPQTGTLIPVSRMVTRKSFIPRVDQYYYKVFIMAQRLAAGEIDLAI